MSRISKDIERNMVAYESFMEHLEESRMTFEWIMDNLVFDYLDLLEEQENLKAVCDSEGVDYFEFECFYADITSSILVNDEEAFDWMENKKKVIDKVFERYPEVVENLTNRSVKNVAYSFMNINRVNFRRL